MNAECPDGAPYSHCMQHMLLCLKELGHHVQAIGAAEVHTCFLALAHSYGTQISQANTDTLPYYGRCICSRPRTHAVSSAKLCFCGLLDAHRASSSCSSSQSDTARLLPAHCPTAKPAERPTGTVTCLTRSVISASRAPHRRVRIRNGCIRYRARGASRDRVDGGPGSGRRWGLRRLCHRAQVALRHGQLVRCFARVTRRGGAFTKAVVTVMTCR